MKWRFHRGCYLNLITIEPWSLAIIGQLAMLLRLCKLQAARLSEAVQVSIAGYVLLPCFGGMGFSVNGTTAQNMATLSAAVNGCKFNSHTRSQIQISSLFN